MTFEPPLSTFQKILRIFKTFLSTKQAISNCLRSTSTGKALRANKSLKNISRFLWDAAANDFDSKKLTSGLNHSATLNKLYHRGQASIRLQMLLQEQRSNER